MTTTSGPKRISILNFTGARANWGCQATSWELLRFIRSSIDSVSIFDLVPLLPIYDVDAQIEARHGREIDGAFLQADLTRGDCPHLSFLERICFDRYGLWADAVRNSDFVVFQAEGTMTGTDFVRGSRLLLLPFVAAAVWGKRVISLNQTVFIGSSEFEAVCRRAFSTFEGVAVRESASVDVARTIDLGPVTLIPDTAFCAEPASPDNLVNLPEGRCFAVTGTAFSTEGEHQAIFEAADEIRRTTGHKAIVIASTNADRQLARWARQKWPKGSFAVLPKLTSYNQVAGVLKKCTFLLGGRYHMLLLAASMGTPFVALRGNSYKNEGLLQLIDWPHPLLASTDRVAVSAMCSRVLSNLDIYREHLRRQKTEIDRLLEEGRSWLRNKLFENESAAAASPNVSLPPNSANLSELSVQSYLEIARRQSARRSYASAANEADLIMDREEAKRLVDKLFSLAEQENPDDIQISRAVVCGELAPVVAQLDAEDLARLETVRMKLNISPSFRETTGAAHPRPANTGMSENADRPSILVVALTIRTFRNILPVLELLRAEGWRIDVVWTPSRPQPALQSPRDLGFPVVLEGNWRDQPQDGIYEILKPDHPFWTEFSNLVVTRKPALILCDDATNWPSLAVHKTLAKLPSAPVVVAFQHGLSQPWHALNSSFHFDLFFAFGMQHVFMFDEKHWKGVLPTGLPKLDLLSAMEPTEGDHLLYVAQHFPDANTVGAMLDGLRADFSDIRIRPHPGHPNVYDALGERYVLLDPASDPIGTLRDASAIVMPHSTSALEAMLLNKHVAMVPSAGLVDFPLLPWVARDFTATEVRKALVQARSRKRQPEYERFLDRICGGRLFKSTEVTSNVLKLLVKLSAGSGVRGHELLERLWSDTDGRQLLEIMKHPLSGNLLERCSRPSVGLA